MENNKNFKNKKKYDNQSKSIDLQLMQHLPPQAIEMEEVVLGAILLEPSCLNKVIDILSVKSFYKEEHRIIYSAILSMYKNTIPIDILTITKELNNNGLLKSIGGAYYIANLTNRVASSANIEYHSRIIVQEYLKREIIEMSSEISQTTFDPSQDVFDIIDKANQKLNDITGNNIKSKEKTGEKIFQDLVKHIEKICSMPDDKLLGVPTGLHELDKITNGWQNSDFIIVAGRPGSGKTSATKAFVNGAINNLKKPVLFFSLEMSASQIAARFISEDIGISYQNMFSKDFNKFSDFTKLTNATNKYFTKENGITKDLLIIDDTAGLSINELKARAKRIKSERDICMVVIDYIQLLNGNRDIKTGGAGNREQEMGQISRGLKQLAKELDLPVVGLAQLSRKVETDGGDMKPKLSHLRESGSLEQDADVVCFLYRPEYYFQQGHASFETTNHCRTGEQINSKGYAEFIVAKHRNGGLGAVPLKFIDYLTKFDNWDSPNIQQTNNNIHNVDEVNYSSGKTLNNLRNDSFGDMPF